MITKTLTADEIKYLPASLGVSKLAQIEKALLDYLNGYIASLVAKNKADEKAIKVAALIEADDAEVDALYDKVVAAKVAEAKAL